MDGETMTGTDLVARLRRQITDVDRAGRHVPKRDLLAEAADEIERLRSELSREREMRDRFIGHAADYVQELFTR